MFLDLPESPDPDKTFKCFNNMGFKAPKPLTKSLKSDIDKWVFAIAFDLQQVLATFNCPPTLVNSSINGTCT
ncbi:hypothetical protein CEXT_812421 [Caerostris extrusa]|uniref:Uncharacterized protein n=1 Tax=Caerostris extrusa TaxID=172846 RepID=A0AAV4PYA9_CAEEX|nr:hypothetical protein CEXT_812421 [Caerostris extrusa]